MYDEHIARGAIQPRQHDYVSADLEVTKTLAKPAVENQPGIRRAFVALLRRGRAIDERRLDPANRLQLVPLMAQRIHGSSNYACTRFGRPCASRTLYAGSWRCHRTPDYLLGRYA